MNPEAESQSQEILLFFHPQSKACIKLRDIVSQSKKNKNLKFVNIDEINQLPKNIKSIPALIINNKVLSGKEVFDYFNKEDEEMEFLGFSGKLGSSLANFYSSIEDDNNNISGSNFSSIDSPTMADGVPTYVENENKDGVKMEDITSQRANLEKELGFGNKPAQITQ